VVLAVAEIVAAVVLVDQVAGHPEIQVQEAALMEGPVEEEVLLGL
jgi:hypothetical protein